MRHLASDRSPFETALAYNMRFVQVASIPAEKTIESSKAHENTEPRCAITTPRCIRGRQGEPRYDNSLRLPLPCAHSVP